MKLFVSLPKNAVFPTFFTPENIRLAESLGQVVWNERSTQMSAEEIAQIIGDSDAYVTGWGSPRLDETILDRAPQIKLLVHLCGTVVPFVSDALWERGIRVISGNDFFALSVAEGTIGYMLTALRDIPKYSRRLKDDKIWKEPEDFTRGLLGKTVGIVSYGAIARHLVRMLAPFGVKLKVYDIKPLPAEDAAKYGLEQVSLPELFSKSDIISLHTPLYDKTHHLIGEDLLRRIPEHALFINTSRGAIVDQPALEKCLTEGRFRAVLDVYEKEPLPLENPLFDCDNVILMPHMAGPTVDLRKEITRCLLLESVAFLKEGGPLPHEISRDIASTMSRK
ncbi:MAG: hydroxyacid dehydrogenase [Clostridia bacterium]|nr:hydroxyacid dehydrogenase [Clostridia bacterium]